MRRTSEHSGHPSSSAPSAPVQRGPTRTFWARRLDEDSGAQRPWPQPLGEAPKARKARSTAGHGRHGTSKPTSATPPAPHPKYPRKAPPKLKPTKLTRDSPRPWSKLRSSPGSAPQFCMVGTHSQNRLAHRVRVASRRSARRRSPSRTCRVGAQTAQTAPRSPSEPPACLPLAPLIEQQPGRQQDEHAPLGHKSYDQPKTDARSSMQILQLRCYRRRITQAMAVKVLNKKAN